MIRNLNGRIFKEKTKEREDEHVHNTDGCRKKRHRNTAD